LQVTTTHPKPAKHPAPSVPPVLYQHTFCPAGSVLVRSRREEAAALWFSSPRTGVTLPTPGLSLPGLTFRVELKFASVILTSIISKPSACTP